MSAPRWHQLDGTESLLVNHGGLDRRVTVRSIPLENGAKSAVVSNNSFNGDQDDTPAVLADVDGCVIHGNTIEGGGTANGIGIETVIDTALNQLWHANGCIESEKDIFNRSFVTHFQPIALVL